MAQPSIAALAAAVRAGDTSAREVVEAAIERIERDDTVNAVVVRDFERAVEAARTHDRRGALAGVPLLVKESEDVIGLRTTFGDPALADRPPATADSSQVAALRAAGAVVVGKTNVPPYVLLAQADNPIHGRTLNPVDRRRSPGGSSGGSAAALALGLAPLATGSDGGGSIRIPSSACGIPGFKPTTGVVPIADDDPYVWSAIDTRSVMAATFADIATALDVVARPSARDPYGVALGGAFAEAATAATVRGVRIGWSPDLGYGSTDPLVRGVCERALQRLEDAGATVEPVGAAVLDADPVMDWIAIVAPETARRILAASPDVSRFDPAVQAVVQIGRTQTATRSAEAETARRRILARLAGVFARFDVLASPTTSGLPPLVGETTAADWVAYTYVFNLASVPAATVPAGFARPGGGPPVPVGLQLSAPRLADLRLFSVATAAETVLGQPPPASSSPSSTS